MFERRLRGSALAISMVGLLVACAHAQARTEPSPTSDRCRDRSWGDDYSYCETRDVAVTVTKSLRVDGRQNGSVTVHGWDKAEIRAVATVEAHGESDRDAQDLAKSVTLSASNGELRADGPGVGRRSSWSVSYELWVPRQTDLTLTAHNGGISVENVDSRVDLETTNGGLNLTDVAGDVRGETANGSVHVDLDGDRWRGTGLDLRTNNGAVTVRLPRDYSARLETGTVNGGMNVDFPITVQGRISRTLDTQLGQGGPPIRVTTHNGSVNIRRR